MEGPRINIHRSFAALLVGNVIAIFLSAAACILIGQQTHPGFFQDFKSFRDPQDQAPAKQNPAPTKQSAEQGAGSSKQAPGPQDPGETGSRPELPFGFMAVCLSVNLVCAVISGCVCVKIAGFAATNHGILMALFLVVWKVQQLLGFVENWIPASLLTVELIALPIACVFGASLCSTTEPGVTDTTEPGVTDTTEPEIAGNESTADKAL